MQLLSLTDYLIFSAILLVIGLVGIFINRKNLILTLISLELVLLAVNTNFIAFSQYAHDATGEIFVFFVLAIAAIKTAVGLAILMRLYKHKHSISIDEMNVLKW